MLTELWKRPPGGEMMGGARAGVPGRLLIQSTSTDMALVSTRLRARGGILIVESELSGLDPKDIIGGSRVAYQTFAGTGIMPDLRPHAAAARDGDVFIQTGGEEICFAIVAAPFVGHTIDGADGVTNEQAGFKPACG